LDGGYMLRQYGLPNVIYATQKEKKMDQGILVHEYSGYRFPVYTSLFAMC